MSKKTMIILGSILAAAVIIIGGIFLYKMDLGGNLSPQGLLAKDLENKNPNMSAEAFKLNQDRYNESRERLRANSDLFDEWLLLGVLKKTAGDYEGARDMFIYAGQIRPKNSSSFASLADIYAYFLNEPEKAEKAIQTAIENDPADASYRLALADIYRYKFPGKENMYEQTLLDGLKEVPNDINLISALATYYRQNDQIAQAIIYYEQLLKLNPDNQTAKQDLAELKAKK